jgi:phage terminase large subunit GpA-like protein
VDVKHQGKLIRKGVRLWGVGSSVIKSELYARLRIEQPLPGENIPRGYLHFPQYGEEYFRQLCAEKMIIKKDRKGFTKYEWVKERDRNEALDLKVYNRALAAIIGIDRFRSSDWERYRIKVNLAKPLEVNENKSQAVKKEKNSVKKKRSSGFW